MDCNQQNKFDDELYKDEDKEEGSDLVQNSMEEREKMRNSASESCEVDDEPKGDEGTDQKPVQEIHKCEFCGREFNSRNALGGHKRLHLQALRKKKEAKGKGIKFSASNRKLICYICHKEFTSQKSLFEHLRFHYEKQGSSSSNPVGSMEENKDDDDNDFGAVVAPNELAIDLSQYLAPGWLQKYKRGRKAIYRNGDYEAARNLLFLKKGMNMNSEVILKKEDKKRKKLIVKLKATDVILKQKQRGRYQCGNCNKSFSSYQALGGHRSSHSKEKNNRPADVQDFDLNKAPNVMMRG
ncbi:zinc finger protein ZAT4-like [Gastrolobium bilobum]|uniref:zinc finger protein ZAT4-like n=1 Tax=Gastrolobium bilobum TaxID=150636 RepID=UPI002AB085D9|nr:zinc finger protein ZAT4-like [Gastrolobium bilobum]